MPAQRSARHTFTEYHIFGVSSMVVQRDNTKVYTIDEIRSIVLPFIELRGMRWAGLFGSYARGDANGSSDIDVLVDKGDARALSVFGLADHLYENTGKRVDVFDVSELSDGPFKDEVMSQLVMLA